MNMTSMKSGDEQHCPEYDALVDMTDDLCKALPITDMFSSLVSLRVIDIGDIEELRGNGSRTNRKIVEYFIETHLYRDLVLGETSRFLNFISAMKESNKCDALVERLQERIKYHQNKRCSGKRLYICCFALHNV